MNNADKSNKSTGGFRSRSRGNNAKKQSQHEHSLSSKQNNTAERTRRSTQTRSTQRGSHTSHSSELRSIFRGVDLPRAVAFDVLYRVDVDQAFGNLILPKLLRDEKLSGRDAAFATELTYGTLRSLGVLDAIIRHCASRELKSIDTGVLNAIRLGAYQIMFTRVEAHAAVDTSVRIVECIGQGKAKGFANAILRTITRTEPQEWLSRLEPSDPIAALAFRYAHPEWIARSFARSLGIDDYDGPQLCTESPENNAALEELAVALEADSQRPGVHLVAYPGQISAEELALIVGGEQGHYSPYAVYLDSGDPGKIEAVRQGLAAVQDEGSQLIARALVNAPVRGQDNGRWLDLCAGPGGKTATIASLARIDGAFVDAVEISAHRAELVRKHVRDLPVKVHQADGRDSGLTPGYDRVLVDAPCSGLGSLRRRPEARWHKQEEEIANLVKLQGELLAAAVALTRVGGVVVYSTCSPDVRETREIVEQAVATLPVREISAHDLVADLPHTGDDLSVQLWPHRHGTDAMFFAVLEVIEPAASHPVNENSVVG
ncbi:MFS transporter [Corynebacterium sp. sy017]|uniref:RsmB/NOP family class I SAM-dependent RNA methyltransferase n=1 Tax=unclassified Corynebacterium TaxID=2624378 RepID=UPI001185BDB7|nr:MULTISPECIES: transcription antitermination factor NusB [unclassified Corynebacterium]MBP3087676.1 MFS transporter [Corynebacterium sp. sy017]TSD92236.1 MFS transporter [Corynebacterium sp. SY003]